MEQEMKIKAKNIANVVQLITSTLELQSVEKMTDCYNKVKPVSYKLLVYTTNLF